MDICYSSKLLNDETSLFTKWMEKMSERDSDRETKRATERERERERERESMSVCERYRKKYILKDNVLYYSFIHFG